MFNENPNDFLDTEHGFAVTAIYKDVYQINVIFDADYIRILDGETVGVEGAGPMVLASTSDVAGVKHGDTMEVNGKTYTVSGIRPDGTGFTELALELP